MSQPSAPSPLVAARYRAVAAGFASRLAGVASWSAATPCTEWAARDLVAHVVDVHRRVITRLDASEPVPVGPDADLVEEFALASRSVAAALDDPARAGRVVESMTGTQPFEQLVGTLLCADTLVHTWDLARATGQDERLDPAAVDAALAFLTPFDDAIRRPGAFGPRLDADGDADAQTRLLHFCGRAT